MSLPHPDRAGAVLAFDGVARTYPGPPPVAALLPFDLVVDRGRFVTIAGPSGSGKSTLLNIMGLLDRPSAGTLWVDGRDSSALSEQERAALRGHSIGFVFQAYHLMTHRTMLENVMIGGLYQGVPRTTRERNSMHALARVGLAHRAHSLTGQLSGGERQRVAIARALVTDPSLILCDEPTGNLDSRNAAEVIAMLQRLHGEGMTVVLVTHDPGLAALGQQQVTIADGVVHDAA